MNPADCAGIAREWKPNLLVAAGLKQMLRNSHEDEENIAQDSRKLKTSCTLQNIRNRSCSSTSPAANRIRQRLLSNPMGFERSCWRIMFAAWDVELQLQFRIFCSIQLVFNEIRAPASTYRNYQRRICIKCGMTSVSAGWNMDGNNILRGWVRTGAFCVPCNSLLAVQQSGHYEL